MQFLLFIPNLRGIAAFAIKKPRAGTSPPAADLIKGTRTFTGKCRNGLQHLLQLVIHKLNLGADNDLAGSLAGTDDTSGTGLLDGLLIDSGVILNLKAQTGCAVVNVGNIVLAADSSQISVKSVRVT